MLLTNPRVNTMSELTKQLKDNAVNMANAPATVCGKEDHLIDIYAAICDMESDILNADTLLA